MPQDTHNRMDHTPQPLLYGHGLPCPPASPFLTAGPGAPAGPGVLALSRPHARTRRGQTAVVALLVLLLLAFIGALFITIIARNLRSQDRSHRTLSADYYAEAGLRFADDQLTNSLDGADWRPPLQYAYATAPMEIANSPRALSRYNAANLPQANKQDPDYQYLSQGFTRYDTDAGRFLLRVTYDPIGASTTDAPNARYLKIESVGRQGVVQAEDPTTYTNQPPTQLAATEVAYKPIGITDYARFETNIDRRSDTANLGVPSSFYTNQGANDPTPTGIVSPGVFDFNVSGTGATLPQYALNTVYGAPDAYMVAKTGPNVGTILPNPYAGMGYYQNGNYQPNKMVPSGFTTVAGGGSLRANMPLRLYGQNFAYLNRDINTTALDDIEVAGNLLLNDYAANGTPAPDTDTQAQAATVANTNLSKNEPSALILNPGPAPAAGPSRQYVAPSNGLDTTVTPNVGTAFDTFNGAVRDGGAGGSSSDAYGGPRSVARLDPPAIDTVSPATRLSRYQGITENSPPRASWSGTPSAAGLNGYGQAIYVSNTSDVQRDSNSLVGGHTLVDEWLNRNSGGQSAVTAKSGWQGPFYNPPGVDITFGPQTANGATFYGVRLTRSDVDASGKPVFWTNADGSPGTSPTLIVSYADLNAINDPDKTTATTANPNNDIVIYAEGNIRVRPSLISALPNTPNGNAFDSYPHHVTLVTNGTAYIEGSILKGNPDSSVTILARDYVCLNTTQFYSGAIADEDAQSAQPPSASAADGALLDFSAQNDVLVQDFNFSPPNGSVSALYVSGGPSAAGATTAQYDLINPTSRDAAGNVLSLSGSQPFVTPFENATFDTATGVNGTGANGEPTGLTHITFNLSGYGPLGGAAMGQPLQLWTRRGPGEDQSQINNNTSVDIGTQDYVQERAAILPGDIAIQAVLYAQDKSFFVIPGPWFNSDTGDNLTAYETSAANSPAPTRPGIDTTNPDSGRFPFYGQPADLKITIDGAVSEARPAEISAQAAWMQKWGWIPQYHGSNLTTIGTFQPEKAGHPGYDPNGMAAPAAGLTLIYDPEAGYPYDAAGLGAVTQNATNTKYYLRSDAYGRPLPFTPKLPVSTGLLYSGQGDPQAGLQQQ